jgi:hypothetical protein
VYTIGNINTDGNVVAAGSLSASSLTSPTITGAYVVASGSVSASSLVSPTITGGSGTTQTLVYKTTSGVGATGADHIFQVGNNGGTEAMRILNNGKVGIGTATPSEALTVNGNVLASNVTVSSDMKLKNIFETISSIDNINTIKYEWKDGRDDRVHIGYGAQEVERILPDAVYTDVEGLKAVNYDEVHTYKIMQLEQVVKELQRQNAELKKLISRKRRIRK